ncbi:phosphatidylglycerophosphatase A family protein [Novispirillum itersonii]|uniref:Phosphatidylglycerophosphatase A n=1 Tax=Novispirillum itersonii TaxID=189 RepID=A0A7W9ZEP4_NOVIT|nr:phosphatidylglycerophosphatase A [Novispirillum itersonii]MBB6210113.1 phosphatidylglycerophosphatase A [Novispirillum itersonii]
MSTGPDAESRPSGAAGARRGHSPVLVTLLATWFGCGLSPKAPGTVGSLGAIPLAAALSALAGPDLSPVVLTAAAVLLFLIGIPVSARYADAIGREDPGAVVIDEVVGILLTLAVAPLDPWAYAIGFLAFRAADIAKPFPVSLADRRVGGGLGIMLDDVVAAGYSALALWAFVRYGLPIIHS